MADFKNDFWLMRLENCRQALEKNNFEAYVAADYEAARELFVTRIKNRLHLGSASFGDSETLRRTGILDVLRTDPEIEFIETFAPGLPREESLKRRRQALLTDLFCTGTNAVTQTGQLVNLDMVGNRVGALTFGPTHVVLTIGRNKLVADVEAARRRIKELAAPLNAIRHEGWKTPCIKTSFCSDCSSPDRICNTWTITEKSYPKHRVKIILINQDGGL